MYFCPDAKVPKHFASRRRGVILFGNEKYPKVLYPNQRLGNSLCTFLRRKVRKVAAHSPTLKVGFAAEAILQVVVQNVLQRNTIVSFSLQNVTIFLSAVQCEISVAFFIFAKRYFLLSASGYRVLQKVAVACVWISFDDVLINITSRYFSATYKI